MMSDSGRPGVAGVILAGGQARRMGGIDKGLVKLAGRPMCQIVVDRLLPQVCEILVNANRNVEVYRTFAERVITDEIEGYLGPLAGVISAMRATELPWIITAPCDGPFLNTDYVERMFDQVSGNVNIVVAADAERLQPTFMLAKTDLKQDLSKFLASGERKIDKWFTQHVYTVADFADSPQCFLNINTEQDRLSAERHMKKDE